jgi:phosphatidylethanolamine/phosphatidyl-N-methylethanolamine N-methyltransferase
MEFVYKWIAPVYDVIYGRMMFDKGRKKAIEMLEIQPGDKILEVGVGTGLTLSLYPTHCHVTGVDLSQNMLKEAESLIKKTGIYNAEVMLMNAKNLKFADNSFDRVLGNLFISATHNPAGALREMKRVCKPGGLIVLMNHFKAEDEWLAKLEKGFDPIARNVLGYTTTLELEPLLKSADLKIKKLEKVNMFKLWTSVSMVNDK